MPDTPELLHIAPAPSERFPAKWYPSVGDGTLVVPGPVLDRPYLAVHEKVQISQRPSGEKTPHVTKTLQARDGLGRTHQEWENGVLTLGEESFKTKMVDVYDPVSHCQFHWTQIMPDGEMPIEDRLALVSCGPQTLRYKDFDLMGTMMNFVPDGTVVHGDTTTTTAHLSPLPMNGFTVERRRVSNTRVDEHGKSIAWSSETWYSPELKEIIRLSSKEESGYEGLTDIHRKEPDPKLFYPPDGYRIELQRAR